MITNFSTSSIRTGVKRKRFWDQSAVANSFFSITTTTLSSAQSSIEFTNIPQTYTHLQIRGIARTSRPTYAVDNIGLQFNSDTSTSKYATHRLYANGDAGSQSAVGYTNLGAILAGITSTTSASSNIFGTAIIDILDYKNTNKYKTTRHISGCDVNAGSGTIYGQVEISSGVWLDTSAITSIKLYGYNGTFQQYSSFALYGVLA